MYVCTKTCAAAMSCATAPSSRFTKALMGGTSHLHDANFWLSDSGDELFQASHLTTQPSPRLSKSSGSRIASYSTSAVVMCFILQSR